MADLQPTVSTSTAQITLPRIAITYCTQCKWLLRAAWLQQELLSTFGTSIGEIALIPSTGGIFQIYLTYLPVNEERANEGASEVLVWDRKLEQGFPEAKVLKQRVRDAIEPGRGLGHSDTPSKRKKDGEEEEGDGGQEKAPMDLASVVRAKGPANPLLGKMRPGMASTRPEMARGEQSRDEAGGEGCEDCK